jgi:hypothetical protein
MRRRTLRTLPTVVLYAKPPFAEIRCRRREQDGTRWNGKVDPGLIYVDLAIYLLCAENIPTQNEAYILPLRPPIPVAVSEKHESQTGTTFPSHENFHAHPPSPLLPDPSANSWNRSINDRKATIADPRPKRNSEINATHRSTTTTTTTIKKYRKSLSPPPLCTHASPLAPSKKRKEERRGKYACKRHVSVCA